MEKKIVIRLCKKADFLWVLSLLKQLRPKRNLIEKESKKIFNAALTSDHQKYFCASIDTKIVWFGSFTIKNWLYAMGKVAILDELIVDESYRKKWIAKRLLDAMSVFAKKKNCVCIELECWIQRKAAHSFYEKYGFEKWKWWFFAKDLV